MYASASWAYALSRNKNARVIDQIHCRRLICYGRLYRTVSYLPAAAICGKMPLKYLICRRAILFAHRKKTELPVGELLLESNVADSLADDLFREALEAWQPEWENCSKGAWTKLLFPFVKMDRPPPFFWSAQGTSGHGVYREYLYRFKRSDNASCPCGKDEESPLHVFTSCERHSNERPSLPLNGNDPGTRRYLTDTVCKLWEEEKKRTQQSTSQRDS